MKPASTTASTWCRASAPSSASSNASRGEAAVIDDLGGDAGGRGARERRRARACSRPRRRSSPGRARRAASASSSACRFVPCPRPGRRRSRQPPTKRDGVAAGARDEATDHARARTRRAAATVCAAASAGTTIVMPRPDVERAPHLVGVDAGARDQLHDRRHLPGRRIELDRERVVGEDPRRVLDAARRR